jgi:hypothetical protein
MRGWRPTAGADADGADSRNGIEIAEPISQGRGAAVHVTVALSTLLGVDEQPGLLRGYGAIPADVAREIAADRTSTWYRLVHDPAGRLVDVSSKRYRPPKSLIEFVQARDQYCRMPTCERAAEQCDIDHRHPFSAGGETSAANTDALCERHHVVKHSPGWRHDIDDGTGDSLWTTPSGRRYRRAREALPLDGTASPPEESLPPPF